MLKERKGSLNNTDKLANQNVIYNKNLTSTTNYKTEKNLKRLIQKNIYEKYYNNKENKSRSRKKKNKKSKHVNFLKHMLNCMQHANNLNTTKQQVFC